MDLKFPIFLYYTGEKVWQAIDSGACAAGDGSPETALCGPFAGHHGVVGVVVAATRLQCQVCECFAAGANCLFAAFEQSAIAIAG